MSREPLCARRSITRPARTPRRGSRSTICWRSSGALAACPSSATRSTTPSAPSRRRPPRRPDVRVGRIRYINCFPVYGAIDRGVVELGAPPGDALVSGNPSELNELMAKGQLDVSVISAVEYARESSRYLLLPDLGITSDGPVRSAVSYTHLTLPTK